MLAESLCVSSRARAPVTAPGARCHAFAVAAWAVVPVVHAVRAPPATRWQRRAELTTGLTREENRLARPATPHDRVNFIRAESVAQRLNKRADFGHW